MESDSVHPKAQIDAKRWDKAQKVVEALGVKMHRFVPSGRIIWTVLGREGDFLLDSEPGHPYCACDDFHFRALSGKVSECYHLIALRRAIEEGLYEIVEFSDEEYQSFLGALLSDIFSHIN